MTGSRHLSEEHKRKLSEAHKVENLSLETRRKLSEAGKGKRNSMFGKHHSLEAKQKMSKAKKGKSISLETIRKRSKTRKEKYIREKHPFFGKHHSLETKKRMSKSKKGKQEREKNSQWLGGKSFEPYGLAFNNKLREQIRARDHYRCQECFRHESELFTKTGKQKKLACHHIDYNKRNNNPSNLIALCQKCHTKTNYKREDWTKYFQKTLKEIHSCKK